VNDQVHPHQELDPREAERLSEDPNREAKEKAFRLAVARRFYAQGQDTAQIAAELEVDESQVWNVLDAARRMRIDA
jgi:hypothetical protein